MVTATISTRELHNLQTKERAADSKTDRKPETNSLIYIFTGLYTIYLHILEAWISYHSYKTFLE